MQRPGFLAGFNSYTPRRARLGSLGGRSGATKWYHGQHWKVCNAMNDGDLKRAINDAAALHDYPINGKKYEEVIQSPQLLAAFKDAFVGFKGKMQSYSDETVAKGVKLIDAALAKVAPKPAPKAAEHRVVSSKPRAQRPAGPTDEELAKSDAEKAKMDAEIRKLEEEQASAFAVPSGIPTTAQTYTGGGMPVVSRAPTATPEEKRQAQLQQMVSSHETERALQRATSPTAVSNAPAAPPPMPSSAPAPKKSGGFLSWIQDLFFGPPAPDYSLGGTTANWTKFAVYGIVVFVLYKTLFVKIDEPTTQA